MKRFVPGFALTVAAIFAVGQSSIEKAQAADTPQVAALKREVQQLQATLTNSQAQVTNLQAQVNQLTAANAKLKGKAPVVVPAPVPVVPLDVLKFKNAFDGMTNAPFVHTVVLKLKADSPNTEVQALLDDLPSLSNIQSVRGLWFGKPADPATPDFAVKDFTVGITVLFDDFNGLNAYLGDPIHKKLADKHLKLWEKPVVYDVLRPVPVGP